MAGSDLLPIRFAGGTILPGILTAGMKGASSGDIGQVGRLSPDGGPPSSLHLGPSGAPRASGWTSETERPWSP